LSVFYVSYSWFCSKILKSTLTFFLGSFSFFELQILNERRWKEVTATFVFPPTATNASYVLRKYYFSLLNNYEQIYFFRSNGQIPPGLFIKTCLTIFTKFSNIFQFLLCFVTHISSVDSMQSPSARPCFIQGAIRPSQELQALTFTPQPKINTAEFLGGLNFFLSLLL